MLYRTMRRGRKAGAVIPHFPPREPVIIALQGKDEHVGIGHAVVAHHRDGWLEEIFVEGADAEHFGDEIGADGEVEMGTGRELGECRRVHLVGGLDLEPGLGGVGAQIENGTDKLFVADEMEEVGLHVEQVAVVAGNRVLTRLVQSMMVAHCS